MIDSFNKMFCKVPSGWCRLSLTGGIAIKTSSGYKVYNTETGSLINCADFVLDAGDDMFFCIPTNTLNKGDIILASGKPAAVIKVEDNQITAFKYEDSTIITIVPEHFVFLGNTYFYSKIVSLFGGTDGTSIDSKNIMQMMVMSEMMKGSNSDNKMMPLMAMSMMGANNPFSGLLNAMNPVTTSATEIKGKSTDKV